MSYDAVLTLRSLETALQRSTDVAWLDPSQFAPVIDWGLARVTTPTGMVLVHPEDGVDEPRIIIHGIGSGESLERLPKDAWRQALQRIHRMALAARTPPLRLPLAWSEYHSGNLVAFFASNRAVGTFRWLAELGPAGSRDISFWRVTDDRYQVLLNDFKPSEAAYRTSIRAWEPSLREAQSEVFSKFRKPSEYVPLDGVIDLSAATYGAVAGHLTYTGWVSRLTPDQRRFFDQPSSTPMKLRGPAGSGKTLALELKALKEVYEARKVGKTVRVLFVTHSWAMAEQVDSTLRLLDEQGGAREIVVFPLVEIAKAVLPPDRLAHGPTLLGEDSFSGRRLLLDRIGETLQRLRNSDWIAYQSGASKEFRQRVEADPGSPEWNSLVWDLMHEFSSVLAASGILPGITAEKRYLGLRRTDWMMPLQTESEKRFALRAYSEYVKALRGEEVLSVDQLVNDFLNYLETFAWDYRRQTDGYDFMFVDEFHLFSDQERQIFSYLSRDSQNFPCLFMSLDPRQSPSEIYHDFPVAGVESAQSKEPEGALGKVDAVDLTAVHRFSPQILEFVKFIHQSFPALELGADWLIDTSALRSTAAPSDPPRLFQYSEASEEVKGVVERAAARHGHHGSSHRVAVVLLDDRRLPEFDGAFQGKGIPLVEIRSRDDIDALRYSKRSVVLSSAEYVGGLQFDDVFVAGFPTSLFPQRVSDPQMRRILSALYVAVSRASQQVEVHFLAKGGEGDLASLLQRAVKAGVLESTG